VEAESGRDQIEQRGLRRQLDAGEVAEMLELAALPQPLDPQPVVEPLERQIDILIQLQLDHRQAVRDSRPLAAPDREDVYHPAVQRRRGCARESGYLGIGVIRRQSGVDLGGIANQQAFEPALPLQAVELVRGIAAWRLPDADDALEEPGELGADGWIELA